MTIISTQANTYNSLRGALWYASRSWRVFPVHSIRPDGGCTCGDPQCKSPAKHPITRRGVHDATTNKAQIRAWWSRWPWANIGLATGAESGFFVLDVDGDIGSDSLQDLEAEHGRLPDTIESVTGSGGRHILFHYPDFQVRNSASTIAPGLDIRGDGGYIVAPRSLHVSGRRYEWEASSRPDEVELAPAPPWLLDLLRKQSRSEGQAVPASEWRELAKGVAEGGRNNAIARISGHLLAKRVNPSLVLQLLIAWNAMFNSPPLTSEEVASTVNSIAGAEWRRRQAKGGVRRGA